MQELRDHPAGGVYRQDWYCPVPPPGTWYQVIRDEWTEDRQDCPVRRVYAIRLAGA